MVQIEEFDSVAVITGASSGIGKEFAYQLAAQGLSLYLISRNDKGVDGIRNDLVRKYKVKVEFLLVDLGEQENIELAVKQISRFKNVKYLINNAGFANVGRFDQISLDRHNRMVNVHINAPIWLTHAVFKVMLEKNFGTIINVSSFSALMPGFPTSGLYGPTKAFLVSFSYTLQSLTKGTKIHIQNLCPGYTYTNFHSTEDFITNKVDIHSKVPKYFWMTAKEVVEKSLKSAEKRKTGVIIPGWKNRLIVAFLNSRIAGLIFNR